MRQRISYSGSDYVGTVIFWIIIICCIFLFFWWPTPDYGYGTTDQNYYNNSGWGSGWWWWIIIGVFFFWWIFALCLSPTDIYTDDDEVRINRPFKTRRFRMDDIQSVEPYQVSKNARKKFMKGSPLSAKGHSGYYHDDNIGEYYAYYGKPDNTVLITLKDGRKFVVGASDAKALSDYINQRINKN